ncbi:MAG: hypothetical protein ACK4FW_12665, partial [Stenotrophomonas sp.]
MSRPRNTWVLPLSLAAALLLGLRCGAFSEPSEQDVDRLSERCSDSSAAARKQAVDALSDLLRLRP